MTVAELITSDAPSSVTYAQRMAIASAITEHARRGRWPMLELSAAGLQYYARIQVEFALSEREAR